MLARIFLVSLLGLTGVSAAEVTKLRAWQAPDQTRLVFDLTGPVTFDVFTVGNPARVVVDLSQVSRHEALALANVLDTRVTGFRYGPRGPNGLRVVFELAHPVSVHQALLPPTAPFGHRLVIDLADSASSPPKPTSGQRAPAPATVAVTPEPAPTAPSKASRVTPSAPLAAPPGPASKIPAWRRDGVVIAIDAGHGGDDTGAIGAHGTYEKSVVLEVARELAALINQQPGMKAVLIRDGDYYIGLRERMERARDKQADLFISIHADAFRNPAVRGSSVFVLSHRGASSEAARWLAEKENAADFVGGLTLDGKDHQLKTTLLDLSQSASLETSMEVADAVLTSLKRIGPLHFQRIQQAGFMVLKSPDIPSLLVETAFISNPDEEQRLRNHAFRQKLAGAIRDGVMAYFDDRESKGRVASHRGAESSIASRQHRVNPGETLSGIAMRYEVPAQKIRLANNLEDDTVRSGELLRIP